MNKEDDTRKGNAERKKRPHIILWLFHSGLSTKTHQHLRTTLREGAKTLRIPENTETTTHF